VLVAVMGFLRLTKLILAAAYAALMAIRKGHLCQKCVYFSSICVNQYGKWRKQPSKVIHAIITHTCLSPSLGATMAGSNDLHFSARA